MQRLMLLDGNGLIYRGYFALPPLTTSKGELVNAVFGFCSIVLRGIQDIDPDYVAVSFDLGKPTFRHEQYAEYKATRQRMPDDLRDQFPKVREVVRALRIPVYELEGYEADDVIGALTLQAEARGVETTIVTGDLDMLQLVTDMTRLMTTRSGVQNTVIYDVARIAERYGLRPDQMVDYKALKGDSTDNIPGVTGVGEKTAAKLIGQWGTLDAMFEHLDEVTPEKLRVPLAEARERVLVSRELMRIVRELPVELDLDAARLGDYDRETVIRLFREYEFRTLIERLPPMTGERAEDTARAPVACPRPIHRSRRRRSSAGRLAGDRVKRRPSASSVPPAMVARDRSSAKAAGSSSASTSTRSVDRRRDPRMPSRPPADRRPTCRPETCRRRSARRSPIPVGSRCSTALRPSPRSRAGCRPRTRSASRSSETTRDRVRAGRWRLRSPARTAGSLRSRTRTGSRRHGVCSTRSASVWSGTRSSRSSSRASSTIRRHPTRLSRSTRRSPPTCSMPRCAARPSPTWPPSGSTRSCRRRQPDCRPTHAPVSRRSRQSRFGRRSRTPSPARVSIACSARSSCRSSLSWPAWRQPASLIDRDALAALEHEFAAEIVRLEAEIYADVGHEFNLGSPKQLEQVLFYELNLPKGRRTKTGYSTDASVLEELRPAHPMIDKLLEWRVYTKLRSTYVEALPHLIAEDGRLHTTFHQAVASTGRLSSSDPNLQNIPIRSDLGRRIRHAFVAGDPGLTLLAADYSQIELRILAHVSGDEHLRDAFARQADIHRETAARVLHKDPADVTADERSMAKMVNFGIAYGMSDFGLSSRAGISRQEAQEFINNYFATYSGISYYMLHIKEVARTEGAVSTLLGRRRQIPELQARNPSLRGAGERMAINMPIQGTAADIMKIAMIRVADGLRSGGFRSRMLLQVHDELLFEVPRDEVDRLAAFVRDAMESALPLDVPLTVDVKVGDSWEGMTPLTRADAIVAELGEAPALDPVAS